MLSKPAIKSPVVGVSRLEQLMAALEIELSEENASYLEELYRPVDNMHGGERRFSASK